MSLLRKTLVGNRAVSLGTLFNLRSPAGEDGETSIISCVMQKEYETSMVDVPNYDNFNTRT